MTVIITSGVVVVCDCDGVRYVAGRRRGGRDGDRRRVRHGRRARRRGMS